MGTVGGTGYRYRGGDRGGRAPWKCPSCQQENVGRVEDGCVACGAGSKDLNDAAQRKAEPEIPIERLTDAIVADKDIDPKWFLKLSFLSPAARVSVAVALMRYAESISQTTSEELPRSIVLGWGKLLAKDLFPDEGDQRDAGRSDAE